MELTAAVRMKGVVTWQGATSGMLVEGWSWRWRTEGCRVQRGWLGRETVVVDTVRRICAAQGVQTEGAGHSRGRPGTVSDPEEADLA